MSEQQYSYECIYKGCKEQVALNGGRTVRVRGYDRPFSLCSYHAEIFEWWVSDQQNDWYHDNTDIPLPACMCDCHKDGKNIMHVMPCCGSAAKYINEDGSIDQARLEESIKSKRL